MKLSKQQILYLIQLIATFCSITGITLISLTDFQTPFETYAPEIAIFSTGAVIILLIQLYSKHIQLQDARATNEVIVGKEFVDEQCSRYLESARSSISILSGDLSWIRKDHESIKRAIRQKGVKIRILYRSSDAEGVAFNVDMAEKANALLACYPQEDDPRLRFLLIDMEEPHARLLVFKKMSRSSIESSASSVVRNGTPSSTSVFEQYAEIYGNQNNQVLIMSMSQLFERMWRDLYQP